MGLELNEVIFWSDGDVEHIHCVLLPVLDECGGMPFFVWLKIPIRW